MKKALLGMSVALLVSLLLGCENKGEARNEMLIKMRADEFNNFKVDFKSLIGKKVQVGGVGLMLGESFILYRSPQEPMNSIFIDVSQVTRDQKEKLLQNCTGSQCRVLVTGIADEVMLNPGVLASDIHFGLGEAPPEKKSANTDAGKSVTPSANTTPPASNTVATSSQVIDIKGLKIGMPIQEARDIININLVSGHSCEDIDGEPGQGISPDSEHYTFGQKVTKCFNEFKFFGGVGSLYTAYADDKLIYLLISDVRIPPAEGSTFYTDQSGLVLYKALAQKYNVKPEIVKKRLPEVPEDTGDKLQPTLQLLAAQQSKFVFGHESAFADPQGNTLKLSGKTIERGETGEENWHDLTHYSSKIELYSSQFVSFKKSRKQNIQNLENQKTQEAEQKKKSDL